jgi:multiple antibiotic resistance protein
MYNILESFILLLFIMDPLVSIAVFMSLTRGKKLKERRRIAGKAVLVAAGVFIVFALGGGLVLNLVGVQLYAFTAAGGVILFILGIQMTLGLHMPKEGKDVSEIAVVIGTPIIAGPATITTTMILVKDIGLPITLIAGGSALLVTLIILEFSEIIHRGLGRDGIHMLSTMMGIVTIAWGLQFLLKGVLGFLA